MSPDEPGKKRSSLHLSLARRIITLAAEQRWPAGYHLRETEIARAFEVSRTPVRAALGLLAEQGVVETRTNQGFFLISENAELTAAEQSLPAAREENVIHAILRDREAGHLPEHLIETELQETYRIGPSALKKVLLQLAEDGLIKRRKGHGWSFVPSLSSSQAREESYRFRMIIECMGLLEPSFRVDQAQFDRCRTAHEAFIADLDRPPAAERFFEINAGFHAMLSACSGNRFLQQAMESQNALRRLTEYADYGALDGDALLKSCREHLAILDALEHGDTNWAAILMRQHLTRPVRPR
jgi:DNA-binding GntR family transcriptional regulator